MKTLIVENEIYLAQSIATKMGDFGCKCDIATTVKDAIKNENYDVVLLSTSMSGQNFMSVVEHYKKSIVILMVSYINNDTVSNPLKAGAKDYLTKPFMIEELINKIKHYSEFDQIKSEVALSREFISDIFSSVSTAEITKKTELPLLIICSSKNHADAYAYRIAQAKNTIIKSIKVDSSTDFKLLKNSPATQLNYIQNFDTLKKGEKQLLTEAIKQTNSVVHSTIEATDWPYKQMTIEQTGSPFGMGEILTVEDYIKSVLEQYQDKYPDIELAKKLGISRKSLWEKRKKHGINKKK